MYKIITIGGKEYKVEYTIEASLYKDFVEELSNYVLDFSSLVAKYDIMGKGAKTNEDLYKMSEDAVKSMFVSQTTQIPRLTMDGFYAGLMEHQNIGKDEAKELYKAYMKEYNKTPAQVLGEIMEKVQEDNFFQMIGLDLTKMKTPTQMKAKKENHTKSKLKK